MPPKRTPQHAEAAPEPALARPVARATSASQGEGGGASTPGGLPGLPGLPRIRTKMEAPEERKLVRSRSQKTTILLRGWLEKWAPAFNDYRFFQLTERI